MFGLIKVEKCIKPLSNIFKKNRSIIIIARNENKKRYYFLINDFYPRCYIESDEGKKRFMGLKKIEDEKKIHYITKKNMLTVYVDNTSTIYRVREIYEKTFESDILFEAVFKTTIKLSKLFNIKNLKNKLIIKIKGINFIIISYKDIISITGDDVNG